MDKQTVTITIAGPCASGKTTIALLLERVLRFNGLNPTVEDIDLGDTHEERQEVHQDIYLQKQRLRALVEKDLEVVVKCVQTQQTPRE